MVLRTTSNKSWTTRWCCGFGGRRSSGLWCICSEAKNNRPQQPEMTTRASRAKSCTVVDLAAPYPPLPKEMDRPYPVLFHVITSHIATSTETWSSDAIHHHYVLMGKAFHPAEPNQEPTRVEKWEGLDALLLGPGDTTQTNCRLAHCIFSNSGTGQRHWHLTATSVPARIAGALVPISCTCHDWSHRGVHGSTKGRDGCKHMLHVRTWLGLV
jgi:hypothetical protein